MIEIRQIKLRITDKDEKLYSIIKKALDIKNIKFDGCKDYSVSILKKSLDARKKPDLYYIFSVGIKFSDSRLESLVINNNEKKKIRERFDIVKSQIINYELNHNLDVLFKITNDISFVRPVIIGFGPAGIFCSYLLALYGFKPIIIERGQTVDKRQESINEYFVNGILNTESNVQFGEGGAGTFSDGKLNTLTKDKYGRQGFVLDTFVKFGANENIKYDSKPHIGTDILSDVVKNIRNEIINLGGTFYFETRFEGIDTENGAVSGIRTCSTKNNINKSGGLSNGFDCMSIASNHLVLATGHSARDTFEMLYNIKIPMEPKSFAVGFRVSHSQDLINQSQYGNNYPKNLEAAPYKLTNTASNGRRVYSFCMCPGGYVVNASSENNQICVNGMSYSKRDSAFANSAIIIGIDPVDFICDENISNDNPLRGMYYQRLIEKRAYDSGNGKVPYQTFGDFVVTNDKKQKYDDNDSYFEKKVVPKEQLGILGEHSYGDLTGILQDDMNEAFIESMHKFGRIINGFDSEDAIMYGIEARTSSPVKILRNEKYESSLKGLYPCGEGAGYAGGIMSAAVDGMKVAEAVIEDYIMNYKCIDF